ncbi:MAG TPA: HNH endonuclease signature motif containing protein, partial [Pseudonocardiaceae bacterium]|nr:HNH endonuclease signature motif containing protein [Pseudonocardiaceae bacterium]
ACARVEELALAAKRAGHPGRIGPLRTDIYLGLLDGRWQHRTREEIITDLLTSATGGTDAGADPGPSAVPGATTSSASLDPHDLDDGLPAETTPASDSSPADAATASEPAATDGPAAADDPAGARLSPRVGVEVRVGLSTLLGRDEHPGEVPGWGPVPTGIAHTMVIAQRAAQWRYAITDPAGRLLLAGITRRRPHHPAPAPTTGDLPPCRGGIVELQILAVLLTQLATDPGSCGEWAGIVADLARQYTRYSQDGWRGLESQDPEARFADAAVRRHVQVRDRCCVHPGCRASAYSADLDHTVDHSLGGATAEFNSGPLCKHDHQLKTAGGWRLYQPDPGHFTWTSPLGRTYCTQPPPITHDLPDPLPRPAEPESDPSLLLRYEGPIMERPPPPMPAPSLTPPDPDEPPPF